MWGAKRTQAGIKPYKWRKKKALRVTKTEHFQLVNDISKFIMRHLCHFTILKDWNEQNIPQDYTVDRVNILAESSKLATLNNPTLNDPTFACNFLAQKYTTHLTKISTCIILIKSSNRVYVWYWEVAQKPHQNFSWHYYKSFFSPNNSYLIKSHRSKFCRKKYTVGHTL